MPLLILALASLACGSFAPRPTRVPSPTPVLQQTTMTPSPTATPTLKLPTPVPTRVVPTPTFTPTPVPGTVLMVGQPARVVAAQGLNVRDRPSVHGERVGRLAPGALVQVTDGPQEGDGYRWWRVRTNEVEGWVADGDGSDEWLSPRLGQARPVNRPVHLGDKVVVTVPAGTTLKVRALPGLDGLIERQLPPNTRLDIVEGPVDADGYRWWKVSNANGVLGWAAESGRNERWLTPLE